MVKYKWHLYYHNGTVPLRFLIQRKSSSLCLNTHFIFKWVAKYREISQTKSLENFQ